MSERISEAKSRNLFVMSTALDIHCFNVHLQRQSLSYLFRRHGELIEAWVTALPVAAMIGTITTSPSPLVGEVSDSGAR